ncbi:MULTISPECIES: acyl-CoA ligase FadD12 [Mycolicibacterium]|uniref:Long-chain-fatty-acid--CoA ligase FadD13 n=1 Tax=Mycolicibacterium vanbaalenii (strain DSM 7251 / JCM 13017 / BCRC 16820 / KCTC 9966 / NRRL B-24157 / PYR-1) TaxID=350058 RepID=A1TCV2_MYCVP|nr:MULTISPECIES: acyl-CoA ligase FadD12 [Mycolicibacterium]ABM15002.1 AMP-dependent synthetase and ligase [Mycolicibacterium vanbaalenii PYR-1]MCV7129904.1 bile acid CoA ligase [Mycolicibacterium vanbaalenii PYR-1]QZY44787.1 acyl-CoA ligase FadD12 [Mycolicibacterium austroafricanum]
MADPLGLLATLWRARLIAPMRPDRYLRMGLAMRRAGLTATVGFAAAAQRCPDLPGIIDELGTLTWKQLDDRCDALAAALQKHTPRTVAVMCRNHRGFVEALVGANRIGADVLLLNTSFAGPAMAEVIEREGADIVIYDQEFTATVDRALRDVPGTTRILAWTDADDGSTTLEALIDAHLGQRPEPATRKSDIILLTSGTTGTPKGAKRSAGSGGASDLKAVLDRTPWRAGEPIVIAAPMFHAWGFSQLLFAALLACPIVTRRKFDPEATLALIDRHRATGLAVVPVMFDRIMELPAEVRNRYSGRSLRFATASGSRMRPDVVTAFMDQFGDVIYNNYNATEAGMIATATPADLRAAPDTAGRAADGTELRILDAEHRDVPTGEVGQIFVRSSTLFDGYTSGTTKAFHDGFMASGDMGYLDGAGRLFVVGRDDEMIVSGGENVYPIEVEKTLTTHAAVAEAAVLGVDDEQYGQRLAAFVVPAAGASVTVEELKQHVRENLANYKVPRDITIMAELPRGSTGKILRNELRGR